MAEYMNISRTDDWNDLSIIDDDGCAIYVHDIGELPRADVVEREKYEMMKERCKSVTKAYIRLNKKINKAIDNVIDKSFCTDIYNDRTDDEVIKLDDVLEILKSIGE